MERKTLIALILSLSLGQVFRLPIGESGISITPTDVLAFFTVTLWLGRRMKKGVAFGRLGLPIFVFIGIGFLSLVLNSRSLTPLEFSISFLYLVRFAFYVGLYFVVRELNSRSKATTMHWLVISGSLAVLFGFVQYFLYPDLGNLRYAGWDEHLYRLFSTFLDPNFAGAFFVLALILLLELFFAKKDKRFHLLLIVGGVLTVVGILLTYSRGAFLMFVVGLTTFLLLRRKYRMLLFSLALFVLGIAILPKGLSEGVNIFRTSSILARGKAAEQAITILKDNPLFGVGFNAYRYAQRRYGFFPPEENWRTVHAGAGTDNGFLFVLATTGIVGFITYLYLWWTVLKKRDPLVQSSVVALFVNSFFLNSLFYPTIMAWVFLLLGAREKE